jgi:hypothetical protein
MVEQLGAPAVQDRQKARRIAANIAKLPTQYAGGRLSEASCRSCCAERTIADRPPRAARNRPYVRFCLRGATFFLPGAEGLSTAR